GLRGGSSPSSGAGSGAAGMVEGREANERGAYQRWNEEQRAHEHDGRDRALQERVGDQNRDRQARAESGSENEQERCGWPNTVDEGEHDGPNAQQDRVGREEVHRVQQWKEERSLRRQRGERRPETSAR